MSGLLKNTQQMNASCIVDIFDDDEHMDTEPPHLLSPTKKRKAYTINYFDE